MAHLYVSKLCPLFGAKPLPEAKMPKHTVKIETQYEKQAPKETKW